jgi:hypothetical protein
MIARSRFRGLRDRLLLAVLTWRPYRCLRCGVRFYDRSLSTT